MRKKMKEFYNRLSIKAKILILGVIPLIIIVLFVSYLSISSLEENLLRLSKDNILAQTNYALAEVEKSNLEIIHTIRAMATAQENGLFGKRKDSINYAHSLLELSPHLTGVYFGYEPNADQNDLAYLNRHPEDSKALNAGGRFLPYWFRNKEDATKLELSPLIDMAKSYYYQGLKDKFLYGAERDYLDVSTAYEHIREKRPPGQSEQYIITEPYSYEGKLIVEQTYPIVMNGKFMGLAGVDRSLGVLDEFLSHLKPFATSDFILISKRGRIISATMDPDLKTLTIEDTPYNAILKDIYLGKNTSRLFERTDPLDQEDYFYSSAKTPTGGWTLVMRVSLDEIMRPIHEKILHLGGVSLVSILLVILILILAANLFARRIKDAAHIANQVAEGDLTATVECSAEGDETNQLLLSIRTMVEKLSNLVRQVKYSSVQVVSTATELSATSKQQEQTVKDFSSSSTEIAASTKEITATSQALVSTMNEVSQTVNKTTELADTGRSNLSAMKSSMDELGQATNAIGSKLGVISEKTNNINKVLTTITKVAAQTNLLSLNASIEAEKAGEYGLGFTVVAREIRRLADQSAIATLDIEQIVKEVLAAVSSGVMEMDKFAVEVQANVQKVNEISEQLIQIIQEVQACAPRFESVLKGMESQSEGAEQISTAIEHLSEAAQVSSSSVISSNQAVERLHTAVKAMSEEISQFKTEEQ